MYSECRPSPVELLSEARRGGSVGLGQLLQLYGNYLKLLASTQIDEKLRARFSPSDVVQDTFFEAHRDFEQFRGQSEAEFLAWLRQILVNNLLRIVEKNVLAAKRDVRREVSIQEIGAALGRSTARLEAVLADQEGSPSSNAPSPRAGHDPGRHPGRVAGRLSPGDRAAAHGGDAVRGGRRAHGPFAGGRADALAEGGCPVA